ncbi:MAG: hypothetical protein RIT04_481 [Candidatus Parcubacteria bacterium]|jgi:hypothetical protein
MKYTKKQIQFGGLSLFSALVLFPVAALAVNNLCDLVRTTVYYFNVAIYMIIGLATVIFVWNVYNYFFKADVENKKDAGLYVMYSVIGFFVILSFWGLVNIVTNTFQLQSNVPASLSTSGGIAPGVGGCGNSGSTNSSSNTIIAGGGTATNTTAKDGILTSLAKDLVGGWRSIFSKDTK